MASAKADVSSTEPAFVELYDLVIDPDETRNLRDEPLVAAVRKMLASKIQEHIETQVIPAQRVAFEQISSGSDARQFSGIYPHLASFNSQGECGTGGVVPWADRLWWITYSPHEPDGSDDKLYVASRSDRQTLWPKR